MCEEPRGVFFSFPSRGGAHRPWIERCAPPHRCGVIRHRRNFFGWRARRATAHGAGKLFVRPWLRDAIRPAPCSRASKCARPCSCTRPRWLARTAWSSHRNEGNAIRAVEIYPKTWELEYSKVKGSTATWQPVRSSRKVLTGLETEECERPRETRPNAHSSREIVREPRNQTGPGRFLSVRPRRPSTTRLLH